MPSGKHHVGMELCTYIYTFNAIQYLETETNVNQMVCVEYLEERQTISTCLLKGISNRSLQGCEKFSRVCDSKGKVEFALRPKLNF